MDKFSCDFPGRKSKMHDITKKIKNCKAMFGIIRDISIAAKAPQKTKL